MNIFSRKFRRALPGLAAFVLIFGVAALVILYFLGYYDLSFLDRYKIFEQDNEAAETEKDVFASLAGLKPDSADISAETSQETKEETNGSHNSY